MSKPHRRLIVITLLACLSSAGSIAVQSDGDSVVRAVLFASPECSHCQTVRLETIAPLLREHGERLEILAADTSLQDGAQLYQAMVDAHQLPTERHGVPTLVIGDVLLIGAVEIPEGLSDLIEDGLKNGGIGWPNVPGLTDALAQARSAQSAAPPAPEATECADPEAEGVCDLDGTPSVSSLFAPAPAATDLVAFQMLVAGTITALPLSVTDPLGFGLAAMVLAGSVAAFVYSLRRIARPRERRLVRDILAANAGTDAPVASWLIAVLVLIGLGIASYLSHVELTQATALCGPVGDCNVTQASRYARLLGVPIGVWGVVYYLLAAALWAGSRCLSGRLSDLALVALLGLTQWSNLFSIYLTCLELFVIRAVCSWCLGSAIVTFALLLVVTHGVLGADRRVSAPQWGEA